MEWNPSLSALPFSPIRRFFNEAAGVKDVIQLSIGQPDFPTPKHIVDAYVKALQEGRTAYELDAGLPRLREAVAMRYNQLFGCNLDASNVLITTGCIQAMYMALCALVKPGKEVIVIEPYFVIRHIIDYAGGVVRPILTTAENNYQPDPEEVIAAMNENTCAIMLNSPGNPTGTVYPRKTMKAIFDAAAERGIAVISDEVYDRLILDDIDYASALNTAPSLENVVVCSSISKSYAAAGLRLGWLITDKKNIDPFQRFHMFVSTTENTPAQYAAVAALEGDQSCVADMVAVYRRRRDIVRDWVQKIPQLTGYSPEGAFFMMPSLPAGVDGWDVALRLMREAGVCTIPGISFGESCSNALRISFSVAEEKINQAFERAVPWFEKQSF
jgi:aspartate/methionine/tyrosine aminotransferase